MDGPTRELIRVSRLASRATDLADPARLDNRQLSNAAILRVLHTNSGSAYSPFNVHCSYYYSS
jgi:hypothetical protein